MTVSPETLLAFIDGELSPEEARRVAAEVANDPALAAHMEKHRALKARLQAVSLPVPEAIPPSGPETIIPLTPEAEAVAVPPQRRPVSWMQGRAPWIAGGAMAIGIALGLMLGMSFRPPTTEMRTEAGKAIAQGPLAVALSRQLASEQNVANGVTHIGQTFFSSDGYFCRNFTTSGDKGDAVAGIACRQDQAWRIRALGATPPVEDGQAPEVPASVRAALNSMIVGQPLNAEGERAARAQNWLAR